MVSRVVASPLTWTQLAAHGKAFVPPHAVNGPTNAQSTLRLFGKPESAVRVTLYRDNHAWCPYCQKTWLWLEEKQIPYRIAKVTMFCYGQKESWYKKLVPSGMLPAIAIDDRIVTESDVILRTLEEEFGPLGPPFASITRQRQLERSLFRVWCEWLCYPSSSEAEERMAESGFHETAALFEKELGVHGGPWVLGGECPSTADIVFVPYVERMCASLWYYKGFRLRDPAARPNVCRWFEALEERETYRGTQSDFHTHAHDLPPQMGGCYTNGTPAARNAAAQVDAGPYDETLPDTARPEPATAVAEAIARVCKHKDCLVAANPCAKPAAVDEALRCALTRLATGEECAPPSDAAGADAALRYVRDRVNVPRDMSLWAARRLRAALEETAGLAGTAQGPRIPTDHRRDQDPRAFRGVAGAAAA